MREVPHTGDDSIFVHGNYILFTNDDALKKKKIVSISDCLLVGDEIRQLP